MAGSTEDNYRELQDAYRFLNRQLFDNQLPDCLITLQRRSGTLGYFCWRRFVNLGGDERDEMALNPAFFSAGSEAAVLSTIAHEATHLWQYHFGAPGRRGYHNRQWANKMIDLGLYPSNTGDPGGRETGYRMTHYIVDGGKFDNVAGELIASGFRLPWLDRTPSQHRTTTAKPVKGGDNSNRWKYTCPVCRLNAWAKPEAALVCEACHAVMPRNCAREREQ